MLYENYETFLSELTKLFEIGRDKGSVYITMKKYDGRKTRNPRKPNDKPKPKSKAPICETGDLSPSEYKCLIRASLRDKKISVVISPKDMNRFQLSYSSLLRGNMHGLKKKQK